MAGLQTTTMVNGEWRTSIVDERQILAAADARDAATASGSGAASGSSHPRALVPSLGLLSRTLFSGSVVKWIRHARIRHKDCNDVLFVGEDFVHLKSIGEDGHLSHVSTYTRFHAAIRSAAVFGDRPPSQPSRLKPDPDATTPMQLDHDSPAASTPTPPQLLVLTLKSSEILFLYAVSEPDGHVTFHRSSQPLPSSDSIMDQLGTHLTVDPQSRALAVGAFRNTVVIYTTKPMQHVHAESALHPTEWSPIHSGKAFRVDGTILQMNFLYPYQSDPDHIVLVVLTSKQGSIYLTCFDWGKSQELATVKPRIKGLRTDCDREIPLLIPLQNKCRFLLVTTTKSYICTNILSGELDMIEHNALSVEPHRHPGSNSKLPLWTSWDSPARHFTRTDRDDEAFYLVREDGVISYVEVNGKHVQSVTAGDFKCLVDTAFTTIAIGSSLDVPDLLVAAGDSSHGQVVKIGAWKDRDVNRSRDDTMSPVVIESLPNWSPLMDSITLADPKSLKLTTSPRHQLFGTSNRSPYGVISEFRWGLEARIAFSADKMEFEHVTGAWYLPNLGDNDAFVLLSLATETLVIQICFDIQGDHSLAVGGFDEDNCGLVFDEETIAGATLPSQLFVQVTRHSFVLLAPLVEGDHIYVRQGYERLPADVEILSASIEPQLGIIVTATRHAGDIQLHVRNVVVGDGQNRPVIGRADQSFPLVSEPTCITIRLLNGIHVVAMACANCSLHLFALTSQFNLFPIWSTDQDENGTHPFSSAVPSSVCGSIAILSSLVDHEYIVVFALRDGTLKTISFTFGSPSDDNGSASHPPSFKLFEMNLIRIGYTPPRLHFQGIEDSLAYISCGPEFCRIDFRTGLAGGLKINSVWFTDRNHPSMQQPIVDAVCYIPAEAQTAFAGYLVGFGKDDILGAQLDTQAKVVPRQFKVEGTPSRLIHSTALNMLVVASLNASERRPPIFDSSGKIVQPGTRTMTSYLQFIPFSNPGILSVEGCATQSLPHGDKIYALIEWTYIDNHGKRYPFVIVGVGSLDSSPGAETGAESKGRLLIFQTRPSRGGDGENGDGRPNIHLAKSLSFDGPVYSVAVLGTSRLAVCWGSKLSICELSSDKKWSTIIEHPLRSKGVYVSVKDDVIYISTSDQSIQAFTWNQDNAPQLRPKFSDGQARNASHHLTVTLPTDVVVTMPSTGGPGAMSGRPAKPLELILVADKFSWVTGLLELPYQPLQEAAPTLFKASLPRAITRLRRANIRPPWQCRPTEPLMYRNLHEELHTFSVQTGVIVDDIVGTASDGSAYAFSILSQPALCVLGFLDGMLKYTFDGYFPSSNASLASFGSSAQPAIKLTELERHQQQKMKSHHIRGDAFEPLLWPNGHRILAYMLNRLDSDALDRFGHFLANLFGHDINIPMPISTDGAILGGVRVSESAIERRNRLFEYVRPSPIASRTQIPSIDDASSKMEPSSIDGIRLLLFWLKAILEVA